MLLNLKLKLNIYNSETNKTKKKGERCVDSNDMMNE